MKEKGLFLNKRTLLFVFLTNLTLIVLVNLGISRLSQVKLFLESWLLRRSPSLEELENINTNREVFRFAVMSDSHIGGNEEVVRDQLTPNLVMFEKAVKLAKDRGAEAIFHLGDLTDQGEWEEYRDALRTIQGIKIPFYLIPGDRDFWHGGEKWFRQDFETNSQTHFSFPLVRVEVLEKPLVTDEAEIFLIKNADDNFEKMEIEVLERELFEKPVVENQISLVFLARPFYEMAGADKTKQVVNEWICKKRVAGVFYGDTHSTLLSYSKCDYPWLTQAYWYPYVGSGSTSYSEFEGPGFLMVHVFENKKIEIERIPVGNTHYDF